MNEIKRTPAKSRAPQLEDGGVRPKYVASPNAMPGAATNDAHSRAKRMAARYIRLREINKSVTGLNYNSEAAPGAANEWDDIPAFRRNRWQKLAAKTNGIFTPGNFVTAAGNTVAGYGIYEVATGNYVQGALTFVAGKAGGDKLDGAAARATHTTSKLGEALDAGFDKLLAVGALSTLLYVGVYPAEAAVPKLATQVAIAGVSYTANSKKGKEMGLTLHPGAAGKWNMGLTYGSIGSFMATNADSVRSNPVAYGALEYVGGIGFTATSIALGATAAISYHKQTNQQIAAYEAAHPTTIPTPSN